MTNFASRCFCSVLGLCLLGSVASAHPTPQPHRPEIAQYEASPLPDRIVLTWVEDPATSQAVTWRTNTSVDTSWAEIAIAGHGPDFIDDSHRLAAESTELSTHLGKVRYHTVRFEELTPRTMYAYRVGDGERWSEWFHFTTASDKAEPFTFIYFGDAQNAIRSMWSRVLREAHAEAPRAAFAIHAGDLVNVGDSERDWGEWFAAGGWLNGMLPVVPVPGNHEYHLDHEGPEPVRALAPTWTSQFPLPDNGPAETRGTAYCLDYQGVRLLALDTNQPIDGQAAWLDERLEENEQNWVIVTMHHPVHSAAANRQNDRLREILDPLFRRHGVDLVLQGHDHTYARGVVNGPTGDVNVPAGRTHQVEGGPVFVVSVSGPKMYAIDREPWMQRIAEGTQLYQVIHVDGDTLSYEARTAKGELYDAFTLDKKAGLIEQPVEMDERIREPEMPVTQRPHQPWVFRCVLDRRARTVVVALSNDVWAAWDAETCDLYKVWSGEAAGEGKGGMKFTGTVYDTRHGPQPQTQGEVFDSFATSSWTVLRDGQPVEATPRWLGHRVDGTESVTLKRELRLDDETVVTISESPEAAGPRALRRMFKVEGLPVATTLRLQLANGPAATVVAEGGTVLEENRGQRVVLFEIAANGQAAATVTW